MTTNISVVKASSIHPGSMVCLSNLCVSRVDNCIPLGAKVHVSAHGVHEGVFRMDDLFVVPDDSGEQVEIVRAGDLINGWEMFVWDNRFSGSFKPVRIVNAEVPISDMVLDPGRIIVNVGGNRIPLHLDELVVVRSN